MSPNAQIAHRIKDQHKVPGAVVASNGAEVAIPCLAKGLTGVAHLHTAQHM
jgi:hypothetical protein